VNESSAAATGAAAAAVAAAVELLSTESAAEGMAAEGATGTGAAAAARLLPPRPSGVGEVSELPPLLLLPAAPGFKRPMNEEVASDETEEVVVSSWERTRAAEGGGGRGRGGVEGGSRVWK
jgi:type IV secretory pathway TrbL component